MNFMLESVKGECKELFDCWKWHYEFTSVSIKKILKILRARIVVILGKKRSSNNNSVERSKKNATCRTYV